MVIHYVNHINNPTICGIYNSPREGPDISTDWKRVNCEKCLSLKVIKSYKTTPGFLYPTITAVLDKFQGMSNAEINSELNKTRLPYAVLMEQFASDNNFGNVVRNANAFGAKEVFYLRGSKGYNRISSVGAYHYIPVNHIKTYQEIENLKDRYILVGIDNIEGAVQIQTVNWKEFRKPVCLIFGEESDGISRITQKYLDHIVEIPMIGSCRSINVASAAAIAMYSIMNGLK